MADADDPLFETREGAGPKPVGAASAAPPPPEPPAPARQRGLGSWAWRRVRRAGGNVLGFALGRLLEPPEGPTLTETGAADAGRASTATNRRVGMLHNVAEQLRGAADRYVAAKLDEIEARVDQKLEQIESRIDNKIQKFNEQLVRMRDEELRFRLRLLRYTLIFTVLVAALSLLYKWASRWLA